MSENETSLPEDREASSPQSNPLFDILGKLLVNSDTQSSPTASVNTATEKEDKQSSIQSAEKPNGDILSSLLQNPELLSKLPQLISILGPILSGMSGSGAQRSEESVQTIQKSKSENVVSSSNIAPHSDNRAALLCAMKPYLGHERQVAVDHIIKLSKLGDILKSL